MIPLRVSRIKSERVKKNLTDNDFNLDVFR